MENSIVKTFNREKDLEMISNVNAYDKEKFQNEFNKTEIYQQLIKDFDEISLEKFFQQKNMPTARYWLGCSNRSTRFSATSFYYLNFLLETNPSEIYDLGCGWNVFKRYIPNIIGVGAESPDSPDFFGDIHDYVDDGYIQGHQNYFESVFSICALHFHPLSDISKVVNGFYTTIRPGGRGYLSLNLQRMIERDPVFFAKTSAQEVDRYCREQISQLHDIKFLVVDIDTTVFLDDGMDGNIRLVMEKTSEI
jgi:hypothetical protein